MRNSRFIIYSFLFFAQIILILFIYNSIRHKHAHEIVLNTLSREYKKTSVQDKILFNNSSYNKKRCLVDKKITDIFGRFCIKQGMAEVGELRIPYHKKDWFYSDLPVVKMKNQFLYVVYKDDSFFYISIIKHNDSENTKIEESVKLEYNISGNSGKSLMYFDYEVFKNEMLVVGNSLGNVYFSKIEMSKNQRKLDFKEMYSQTFWLEGPATFLRNTSNIFIVFKTGYFIKSMPDEPIYLIVKYDPESLTPQAFRSFRDINIGYVDSFSGINPLIKIDDNEDIYFKSYADGNVYSINYNSLSEVDTLAEFTKKKFLNLFK